VGEVLPMVARSTSDRVGHLFTPFMFYEFNQAGWGSRAA
jgi:hypothetical protein